MKKVGLKIVLPIVISMTLILTTLVLLATVVMPKSLDNQAREAITLEYKYGDAESDDERAKKNLLSANVGLVEVDQLEEELAYLTDTERALLSWYKDRSVEVGKFYNIKTSGKNIVFAVYTSSEDINNAYRYILYVDTSAINKYV